MKKNLVYQIHLQMKKSRSQMIFNPLRVSPKIAQKKKRWKKKRKKQLKNQLNRLPMVMTILMKNNPRKRPMRLKTSLQKEKNGKKKSRM